MSDKVKSYISVVINEEELSVIEIPTPVAEKAIGSYSWSHKTADSLTINLGDETLIHINIDR